MSCTCKTYEDVLTSNHLTLDELAQRSNNLKTFTLSYIAGALTAYLDFIGRRNTMNDTQVAETAMLILEEFPKLKIDDIALFFRYCKTSHFGKLYDINGATIFEWINTYCKERGEYEYQLLQVREKQRQDELERQRQAEWDALTPEQQAEQLQQIKEIQQRLQQKFIRL